MLLLILFSLATAKDCLQLFQVRKSLLSQDNPLLKQLAGIGELNFTQIEAKLNSNLIDFCAEIAQSDLHCFSIGTAL